MQMDGGGGIQRKIHGVVMGENRESVKLTRRRHGRQKGDKLRELKPIGLYTL